MKHLLTILLFLISSSVFAQSLADNQKVSEAIHLLDVWLDAERDYRQIPGISIGIVHDQEMVWSKGFGYANLENKTPATPNTIYSICSISKLFTSVGLMQLRDQGKFHLDDPIDKHLEWFNLEQTYENSPDITVEGILTHSSGLPRESNHPYWTGPDFPFPSQAEIQKEVGNQKTLYPPHTYFQYSNLGLTLAGELVEELSGKPYKEYIKTNILDPLELNSTRTELPKELLGKELATGYGFLNREGKRDKVKFFDANGIAPAAGYSSNVNDLGKFASWQFRLLDHKEELLKPNTLKEMHRVHFLDPNWRTAWGLGFATWNSSGEVFVGHGGSCPGYRTQLILQPKAKIATVFMANGMINSGHYARTAYKIMGKAIQGAAKEMEKEKESDEEKDEEENKFAKYFGTYDSSPWGGEVEVLTWNGKLSMLYLPSENPLDDMMTLKHIEGNTFRRVRRDDELGEEITFIENEEGKITAVTQHNNFSRKLD